MRRLSSLFSIAALLGLLLPDQARAESWLVMSFLPADDEKLEGSIVDDVLEMQQVGSSDDLTILVFFDRGGYSNKEIKGLEGYTQGAKQFVVDKDGVSQVTDMGTPGDSGTPQALAKFLGDALQAYPDKDRYVLTLSDHGMAYGGCCGDHHPVSGAKSEELSVAEIVQGIKDGLQAGGKDRLDLIGFDECLMGSFEVARAVAPYASYMIGSEETEAGSGWTYHEWLGAIASNPSISFQELGTLVVDTFIASLGDDTTNTLAVYDLAKMNDLLGALSGFATKLKAEVPNSFMSIAKAKARSNAFGKEGNSEGWATVDLGQFATLIQQDLGGDVGTAAAGVLDALNAVVLYHKEQSAHEGSMGMSIHMPNKQVQDYTDANSAGAEWVTYLEAATQKASEDTSGPEIQDVAAAESENKDEGSYVLTATTVGDDIDEVSVILGMPLGDGTTAFLGEIPIDQGGGGDGEDGGGAISFEWDGRWPMLYDANDDSVPATPAAFFVVDRYTDGGQPFAIVSVPVSLDPGWSDDLELEPALLYYKLDLTTYEGDLMAAFADDQDGGPTVEIDLNPMGAVIRPEIPILSDEDDYATLTSDEDLPLDMVWAIGLFDVPDGDYFLGIEATDFVGNTNTEVVELNLTTEGGGGGGDDGGGDGGCSGAPAGSWQLGGILLALLAGLALRRRRQGALR